MLSEKIYLFAGTNHDKSPSSISRKFTISGYFESISKFLIFDLKVKVSQNKYEFLDTSISYCKFDVLEKTNFVFVGEDKIVSFSQMYSSPPSLAWRKEVTQVCLLSFKG